MNSAGIGNQLFFAFNSRIVTVAPYPSAGIRIININPIPRHTGCTGVDILDVVSF
jgi:hypothetical protein